VQGVGSSNLLAPTIRINHLRVALYRNAALYIIADDNIHAAFFNF
jgi:hypothetical protein